MFRKARENKVRPIKGGDGHREHEERPTTVLQQCTELEQRGFLSTSDSGSSFGKLPGCHGDTRSPQVNINPPSYLHTFYIWVTAQRSHWRRAGAFFTLYCSSFNNFNGRKKKKKKIPDAASSQKTKRRPHVTSSKKTTWNNNNNKMPHKKLAVTSSNARLKY